MTRKNVIVQDTELDYKSCNNSISLLRNNNISLVGLDLPKESFSIYYELDQSGIATLANDNPGITRFYLRKRFSTECFDKRKVYIDFAADNFILSQFGLLEPSTSGSVKINSTALFEIGYGFSIGLTNNNLIYDGFNNQLGGINDNNNVQDITGVSSTNQYAGKDYDITEGQPNVGGFISFNNELFKNISLKSLYGSNGNYYIQTVYDSDSTNLVKISYNDYRWIPNRDTTGIIGTVGQRKELKQINLKFLSEYKGLDYTLSVGSAQVLDTNVNTLRQTPYLFKFVYENKLNIKEYLAYHLDIQAFNAFNVSQAHNNNDIDGFVKGYSVYTEFLYKNDPYYDIGGFVSYERDNRKNYTTDVLQTPQDPHILTYGINFAISYLQLSYAIVDDRSGDVTGNQNNNEIRVKLCRF